MAGWEHYLCILSDGSLWAWGWNDGGQLGDGTTAFRGAPVHIQPGTTWSSVCTNDHHSAGIKSDGSLWTWGWNWEGQLGDGTTTNRYAPTQIQPGTTWSSVSTGTMHTVAIRTDGTLWVWGIDAHAHNLENITTPMRTTPTQIQPGTTWLSVSAGSGYTLAIRDNNSLWVWGWNDGGQLGDGTTINRFTPVQIQPGTTWSSVSAGSIHSLGIRTDGSLWTWGRNARGQLGDGTTINRHTPTHIQPGTTWSKISAGWSMWGNTLSSHSLGIRTDGSLWAWGDNWRGQLGDGSQIDRHTPTHIQLGTTWSSVAATQQRSVGVREDGTLWGWGRNLALINVTTPTQRNWPSPPPSTFNVNVVNGTANQTTNVAIGTTVVITANTPPSGQRFANWTTTTSAGVVFANANNASTTFTMPANAVTVTANFENIPQPPLPTEFTVTAVNGTSSASTTVAGATVTITANIPPSGQRFVNWTTTSAGVVFANANSASTTFAMPNNAVTVTANFENVPPYENGQEPQPTPSPSPSPSPTPTPPPPSNGWQSPVPVSQLFPDSQNHWAAGVRNPDDTNYIGWAMANDITSGFPNGTFRPNGNVTRAQFTAFLYRIAEGGTPPVRPELEFGDMRQADWHHGYVAWAYSEDIVAGFPSNNTFRPDNQITREQLVLTLFRYVGESNVSTLISQEPINNI